MTVQVNQKLKKFIKRKNAVLVLENEKIFWGQSIGLKGKTLGEICFNTSMTGYQEIITDPSYANQIITFTFPHIGIVGTNLDDNESKKPAAKGIIIREISDLSSNYRSTQNFNHWLKEKKIIGIQGIDTRSLTSMIRNNGFLNGMIISGVINKQIIKKAIKKVQSWKGIKNSDLTSIVTTKTSYNWSVKSYDLDHRDKNLNIRKTSTKYNIVVIDFGVKFNILRMLADRNFKIKVLPAQTDYKTIMNFKPDGIFLSNGPGDPEATSKHSTPLLKKIFKTNIPIFGICLGHQLIALALNAKTEKMSIGHRGANQPVKNIKGNKVEITSQNHGFVVKRSTLNKQIIETHTSLFDGVLEGLKVKNKPILSVQYHPEASPGPQDTGNFFDIFLKAIVNNKQNAKT